MTKLCTKCGVISDNFYLREDIKGNIYFQSYCKPCSNSLRKKYAYKYYYVKKKDRAALNGGHNNITEKTGAN